MAVVVPVNRPVVAVSRAMFAEQRRRLASTVSGVLGAHAPESVALFKGASDVPRNSSDTHYLFKQDAYFQYLFGYETADCYGAIEIGSGRSMIFIPRLPESYAVWMGRLPLPEEVVASTQVDAVHYVDEIPSVFKQRNLKRVLVLNGVNVDSDLPAISAGDFPENASFTVDTSAVLFDAITEQRVFKTKLEHELLHEINKISSRAHVAVMKHCRPGLSQHHLESTFLHFCYYEGRCRHISYQCICATGKDASILHYITNDHVINDGDFALLDMGGEYHGYASDITCCFPVNGRFTPTQTIIYEAVLRAHDAVMAALKPGVDWVKMQELALITLADGLRAADLIRGTNEELMEHDIMYTFLPHGLGHLLGLDVHDVGGYTAKTPPRPTKLSFKKLRTARILEPNIYITVEPGCYFNSVLLEPALKDPATKRFYNEEKLRRPEFWNFGGVRIESNVMITETGVVNFTNVPRTVVDIEAVMAGTKEWTI